MTTEEAVTKIDKIEYKGQEFAFVTEAIRETNIALLDDGWTWTDLTSGNYAGTPVVETWRKLWDETGIKPLVFRRKVK